MSKSKKIQYEAYTRWAAPAEAGGHIVRRDEVARVIGSKVFSLNIGLLRSRELTTGSYIVLPPGSR